MALLLVLWKGDREKEKKGPFVSGGGSSIVVVRFRGVLYRGSKRVVIIYWGLSNNLWVKLDQRVIDQPWHANVRNVLEAKEGEHV